MSTTQFLVLAGSTRKDSYNKKLARIAGDIVEKSGARATVVELNDFPLKLYDTDEAIAHGYPSEATALKQLFLDSDGVIIVSPEYNGSLTAVLKNAIDWLSRSSEITTDLSAFKNKPAMVLSTSLGGLGGLRGLRHLREILTNLHMHVVPSQLAVPFAGKAFTEQDAFSDQGQYDQLNAMIKAYVAHAAHFKNN